MASGKNDIYRRIPAMASADPGRSPSRRRRRHNVVALIAHGVAPFELGVACEVFGIQRPELVDPWYRFVVCSADEPPIRSSWGSFSLVDVAPLSALDRADTVVIPAWPARGRPAPPEVVAALRRAHRRGARILTVCSGAFLVAQAGLLDGLPASTHWMYAAELAEQFPSIDVRADVLYVDAGQVLTSAGTAAGIDLCLHVVRLDHGAEVANAVARRMVVPPQRHGGQAQFAEAPVPCCPDDDPMADVVDWAVANLDTDLTIEVLAGRAAMSPRTFARRFRAATGTTPLQWVLRQRVLLAQRLLETTDEPVERVAQRVGFGSAAVLREHFGRQVHTTPQAYRRAFREESA
jgi:transcriptional regulator GlxA family with amidase domain